MSAPAHPLAILVGTDGSKDSERAIDWAAATAALHPGSSLHLLEALALPALPVEIWSESPATLLVAAESAARARLAARAAALGSGFSTATHVRRYFPVEATVELAAEIRADLVVLGRHGHSSALRRTLIGSVSGEVSRSAECPVAVVRGDQAHPVPPRRLLVALDGSEPSRVAARAASKLFPGAAALAVSVGQGGGGLDREAVARDAAAAGLGGATLEVEVVDGDPASELLRLADGPGIDLVVAGRRGQGSIRELLLGGVAEKLLQLAPCPILLAH